MRVKQERCDKQEWMKNWVLRDPEGEEEGEDEECDTTSYVRT